MNNPRAIIYTPHRDSTPEGECRVLAAVYAYVLACGAEHRKTTEDSSGQDNAQGRRREKEASVT